jgi:hypothetical protein
MYRNLGRVQECRRIEHVESSCVKENADKVMFGNEGTFMAFHHREDTGWQQ